MITKNFTQDQLKTMLAWQVEMGADEALLDKSSDDPNASLLLHDILGHSAALGDNAPFASSVFANVPPKSPKFAYLEDIDNLPDLASTLGQLESCPLKQTASNTCFSDGNAEAQLMIIGEAPGRDEDRVGMPFVGAIGQFLDRMLASIGLDRRSVYLTNFLPWRPPGNRSATAEEIEMLLPFLYRHIQLANPKLVLILGGTPAKTILKSNDNILKLRGCWQDIDYGDGVMRPTMASLHPTYLICSPAQKRLAFDDWCMLYQRLGNKIPLQIDRIGV